VVHNFMRKIFSSVMAAVPLLAGCVGYEPFQPPPGQDQRWKKDGATDTEIVNALLECGVSTPRGANSKIRITTTPDEVALSRLCMEHAGFVSDFGDSWAGYCRNFRGVDSCKTGTMAPRRDINKRLNSQFCKIFPNADVCD
jgi:hypothetical protein